MVEVNEPQTMRPIIKITGKSEELEQKIGLMKALYKQNPETFNNTIVKLKSKIIKITLMEPTLHAFIRLWALLKEFWLLNV